MLESHGPMAFFLSGILSFMSRQSGYTLIEIMLAVAIIGIITSVALPLFQGYTATSREGAARANLDLLKTYQENYYLENGTYLVGSYCYPDDGESSDMTTALGWAPDAANHDHQYLYEVEACDTGIDECYVASVTPVAKDDCERSLGNAQTYTKSPPP